MLYAAVKASCEAIYLRNMLFRLGFPPHSSTTLWEDNTATIAISIKPALKDCTKHLGVKKGFLRDVVKRGWISLEYVNSSDQITDIFTKPLPRVAFQGFRSALLQGRRYTFVHTRSPQTNDIIELASL